VNWICSRRAELLGSWEGFGITTTIAIPLVRLMILLWGVNALARAGGGIFDISYDATQNSSSWYGGCDPSDGHFYALLLHRHCCSAARNRCGLHIYGSPVWREDVLPSAGPSPPSPFSPKRRARCRVNACARR